MVDESKDDDGGRAAALEQAIRDAPEVQLDALRRTVRLVLQLWCAELEESGENGWPPCGPSELLRLLVAQNEAAHEHVEAVTRRLFALVGVGAVLQ